MSNTLRLRSYLVVGASAAVICAMASPVFAADAGAATGSAASSADNGSATLEAIVVTAEKREANLQDVPIAVTAFTSKERAVKGINTVQDMTNFTPGLTYSSQLDRPVMRGIARNNNIYLSDSAVAVYNDDVYSNSTALAGRDDMIIDQVEVLLGPQGTLYGRNSIGGLINVHSKRPTDTFTGEGRVSVGNYGYTMVEGTVSGPLGHGFSARLSAYDINQTGGWLHNLVPGSPGEGGVRHDPYVDLQLQYKDENNKLWIDVNSYASNHDRGGPGSLLGTPNRGAFDCAPVADSALTFNPNYAICGTALGTPFNVVNAAPNATTNPALSNIRNFAHSYYTDISVHDAFDTTIQFTHHFDGFDVKYTGGYDQYKYLGNLSAAFLWDNSSVVSYQLPISPDGQCAALAALGCGPLTINPTQSWNYHTFTRWTSHEITVSSTNKGPLQWIGGVYFYWEGDDNPEELQSVPAGTVPAQQQIFAPANGAPNPRGDVVLLDYQDNIYSVAGYGQLDWQINKDWKVTAGLRYTHDHKTAVEETRYVGFLPLDGCVGGNNGVPACATGTGINPANLGSFMPAIDLTTALISMNGVGSARGITCDPSLDTDSTSKYYGDWTRCLGDSSSAVTGTFGISWTPDDQTLVYGRYNRGYKAFGFAAGSIVSQPEAAPEYVNDFEIGLKKTWNHSLQVNLDGFYYDYTNDQVNIGVPVGTGATATNVTEFINIPKAVSSGIELSVNWAATRDLNLSLTYGYNHTSIHSDCVLVSGTPTGTCLVDASDPFGASPQAKVVQILGGAGSGGKAVQSVKGNELPQAPPNKIALNATYVMRFDPGNLTLSGSFIWKDVSYADIFQRTYNAAPAWNQVDLRATWAGRDDRYEVVLYVKNVFNSLGYDAAGGSQYILSPQGGGAATQSVFYDLTPPRTYGAEFHVKF